VRELELLLDTDGHLPANIFLLGVVGALFQEVVVARLPHPLVRQWHSHHVPAVQHVGGNVIHVTGPNLGPIEWLQKGLELHDFVAVVENPLL